MIICYESRGHHARGNLSYIEFIKNKVSHKEALKYIIKLLRFSSTFKVHLSTLGFSTIVFPTTKLGNWSK